VGRRGWRIGGGAGGREGEEAAAPEEEVPVVGVQMGRRWLGSDFSFLVSYLK
jgi:hypothetical protein